MVRAILALAVLALLAIAGGAAWYDSLLEPLAERPALKTIEVEPGESLIAVTGALERQGLIRSARAARIHAEWNGMAGRLQVGEYELSADRSTPEILQTIVEGRVKTYKVVLPEGIRAVEIATRLADAGIVESADAFLAYVLDPESAARHGVEGPNLEGYLFPDTYRFARNTSPSRIADAMVEQFERVWETLAPEAAAQGRSQLEVVTLASIVEKETAVPAERPLIAAVFLNRMKKGMRLETDPTVIYGIPDFDGNLRRVHLQDESNPYNTYRIRGLPPGPIASPGRESLEAVLFPADSPYLYFVSRNDGTHEFSITYREHVSAVNRFQRRRRSP